jgi:uncharacterized protein YjbJ (UPF0337 family)
MNSQGDKVKGKVNSSIGEIKQAAGRAIDDKDLERRGIAQERQGEGQKIVGAIKEKFEKGTHALNDGIEKVGKKFTK